MQRTSALLMALVLLGACGIASSAPSTPQPAPTMVRVATATALPEPTAVPPTTTPEPTAVPLTAEPILDPVAGLTIADLRARAWGTESDITIGEFWSSGVGYTVYRMYYRGDGLNLTGLIFIPAGSGPFPVIIANRGYISPETYVPGTDSYPFADVAARAGYLVLAPDYRGYGGGDAGPNPFYTGYYADILHLIPMAQRLPMARPDPVGLWGHSRGASINVAAITIMPERIAAAVAYAPAYADLELDYYRRYNASGGNPGTDTWPFPPSENPDAYRRVSPLYHMDSVTTPLMLHHGTLDTVVDISASVQIADTLRALNKNVTFYVYEGSGHLFNGSADQLYYERTMSFFTTYLGQ